ncbi:hypothetical protein GCM10023116_36290 [Kistimonas scapharcae]|uniref:Uncharacterized protein n=1 Tax=Kistimonas scapharcae TaxID=1036133 RepID=A0ABP8V5M7_9GAMM
MNKKDYQTPQRILASLSDSDKTNTSIFIHILATLLFYGKSKQNNTKRDVLKQSSYKNNYGRVICRLSGLSNKAVDFFCTALLPIHPPPGID